MIELSNIHFQYPKSVFKLHINKLHFESGSKTAIIGPSGHGKTTMLNLLAGILLPDSGDIKLDDTIVNNLTEKERRNFRIQKIGFVFQDFRLIPYLNIMDNILLPYRINSILKIENNTINSARKLAEDLSIRDKLTKYPAKIMLWEDEPLPEVKEALNKKGINVSVFNPCGNKPENADFITIMQKNIKSLNESNSP